MTKVSELQEENQMLRVQLLKHKLDLIVLALTPESRRAQRIRDYWMKQAGREVSQKVAPDEIINVLELSNTYVK